MEQSAGASPGHPLQAALNVIVNCLQTELHAPPGLWERAQSGGLTHRAASSRVELLLWVTGGFFLKAFLIYSWHNQGMPKAGAVGPQGKHSHDTNCHSRNAVNTISAISGINPPQTTGEERICSGLWLFQVQEIDVLSNGVYCMLQVQKKKRHQDSLSESGNYKSHFC